MTVGRRNGAILRQLRTLYNVGTIGDLTDGQLLEQFATSAGEVAELAFAALVERHQAKVWRACLAIVRNEHEAEDAFQATFLVLVHRARSLWVRDSLGPWLHQVACRTASCLRRSAIRRRRHERRSAEADAARSPEFAAPRDTDRDAAIHEELNRLPENPSSCATSKAGRTGRPPGSLAGRSVRSRAGSRTAAGCFETDWRVADWALPSLRAQSSH